MKKLLLTAGALLTSAMAMAQLKYVDSMYANSGITVTKNIQYCKAMSVLTGSPKLDSFYMDVYNPTGNTDNGRPLIIMLHTGNFLPRYKNKQPTGARDDSAMVAICKKFAQRGYVVAAMSYRLGWNPISTDVNVRRGTIINAAYRGVQDLSAAIRYIKRNIKEGGNTWSLDSTKIAVGGQGTGGYVTLAYASLDRQSEIRIPKFYDFSAGKWMVQDSALLGDIQGFRIPGTTGALVVENHKGYTSDAKIAFNFGGALGDTSWLETGGMPIISAQGVSDPFAPYKYGIVTVPGTSPPLTVVDVSGSYDVMKRVNQLNLNDCYKGKVSGLLTMQANRLNDGYEGLLPLAGAANGSGPWEWWADTNYLRLYLTGSGLFTQAEITEVNENGYKSNPFVSKARALRYLDTLVGYFAPRVAVCLGLQTSVSDNEAKLKYKVSLSPNPARNMLNIDNNSGHDLQSATITDINGKVVKTIAISGAHSSVSLDLPAGMYLVQFRFPLGSSTQKLIVE
ncbi:MAG: T9SS type A sorting domain-containing protein [Bacteroidetes bacterium]|nr:T9SS type A sorting domain-containing protein [Bacteroidota bacterium]